MFHYSVYESPVGTLTLADRDGRLAGLWIEGQKYHRDLLEGRPCREAETPVIRLTKVWLDRYFAGGQPGAEELPLEFIGSDFRRQVWSILARIPYGQVITYGDIARQIARQRNIPLMSARAVGGAVGRNPISIIVPCHRVVGSGGSLTGYAGGLDVKRKLLALEGVDL